MRKKFGRICALVVVGMFIAMALSTPVPAGGPTDTWKMQGNDDADADDYLGTDNNFPLKFYTNAGERMRITTDGKVGLGTTSPDNPLELLSATTPQLRITNTDATDYATFAVDTDGQLDITTVDGEGTGGHICLVPDGNVGIGTTSPGVTLHIKSSVEEHIRVQKIGQNPYMDITSGGSWCGLELHSTNVELFSIWEGDWDTGQNRFHIRKGGNIGIGTTTPGSELDVAGTITGDGLVIDGTVSGTGFNGWDRDDSDDLTTSTGFDGDVSGIYNDLQLRPEVVGSAELASSGVTAGTYGSATQVAQITVDGDGRITSASNVDIIESDPQVGSISTNYVPKWDGSALVTGTMYDNGNVGIGTTDPDGLEITVEVDEFPIQGRDNVRLGVDLGTARIIFEDDGTLWEVDNAHGDFRIYQPGTVRLQIESNGYVGIGTTNPGYNFEVESSDAASGTEYLLGAFDNSVNGGGVYLGYLGDGTDASEARVRSGGSINLALGTSAYQQAIYILNSNGNVGIGETSPSCRLHVKSKASDPFAIKGEGDGSNNGCGVYGFSWSGSLGCGVVGEGGQVGVYGLTMSTGSGVHYGVYGDAQGSNSGTNYGIYGRAVGGSENWAGYFAEGNVYIENNLGIGTTNSYVNLEVQGAASENTAVWIDTYADGYDPFIAFQQAGATKYVIGYDDSSDVFNIEAGLGFGSDFVIDSSGNVGIGTSNTYTKLRVYGDVAFAPGEKKTIGSGAISVTHSYHTIDTEGGAATDNLDVIYFGDCAGRFLILRAANSARTVVVRDESQCIGNIILKDSNDFSMDHVDDTLILLYDGDNWLELSRSNNS